MRIREDNRNIFLLATVTLCCSALAGAIALFEPAPAKQQAQRAVIDVTAPTPVRVGGAPVEPNLNPRERYPSPRRDVGALLGTAFGAGQLLNERDHLRPFVGRQRQERADEPQALSFG